ncbi:MAG: FliI/YscN family ATPase [Thermaerobacter sp.]|nr:FliI/YscN family ATPase [Thermaerobacter sp.]
MAYDLERYRTALHETPGKLEYGRVVEAVGLAIQSQGPRVGIGELCYIEQEGRIPLPAEVVGFREGRVILMPLGKAQAITPGAAVRPARRPLSVPVGKGLVSRVVNALGEPIDSRGAVDAQERIPTDRPAPNPLQRPMIDSVLPTGVRAIDALATLGEGQRVGIFSGPGVGKSVLLGMMARGSAADVAVIALVGERSREVQEFVQRDLGPDGMARSVVVVATADEPALVRVQAAFTAMAIAEYFRDQGQRVLLLFDSLTRVATAQREVGLAAGEPPATRGYPPSSFAILPRLLERAGTAPRGSITGFYTVLVEGDDLQEPVADSARSVLDGHLVLTRELADAGVFPALDVGRSLSRVMRQIVTAEHTAWAQTLKGHWSTYEDAKDLLRIGAYQAGSSAEVDAAVAMHPRILAFLRQPEHETVGFEQARQALMEVAL